MSSERFARLQKVSIKELRERAQGKGAVWLQKQTPLVAKPDILTIKAYSASDIPVPENYFPKEPGDKDITHKTAYDFIIKHNAFISTLALTVPGLKGAPKAFKFSYPDTGAAPDYAMWDAFTNHVIRESKKLLIESNEKSGNELVEENIDPFYIHPNFIPYLNYVRFTTAGNGKLGGVVWRIVTQLPRVTINFRPSNNTGDYLGDHFILNELSNIYPPITSEPDFDDTDIFKINEKSDAGCPFMITDKDAKCDEKYIDAAIKFAENYVAILNKDDMKLTNMKEYMFNHPEEFTIFLKRKNERFARNKIWTKVRPYYVLPFGLKMLFMWASHYVENGLLGFWEEPESNSAYKFSWFYGGAQRLVKLIKDTQLSANETDSVVFKPIAFGDDQFWIFAYPDGRVIIMAPDVNGMDMKCTPASGSIMSDHVKDIWSEAPKLFHQVVYLICTFAFKHRVHLCGGFAAYKMRGLISGIPLTTILDIYNSNIIQATVASTFGRAPKIFKIEEFDQYLEIARKRVADEIGFTFKDETWVYETFENVDQIESIDMPFLGMKIKSHYNSEEKEREFYPVPAEPEKLAGTLCLPTNAIKRGRGDYAMERMYGAYLSGAWCDQQLSEFIVEQYNTYGKNKCVPSSPGDLNIGLSEFEEYWDEVCKPFVDNGSAPPLPSRETVYDMYVMDKEAFVEKHLTSPDQLVTSSAKTVPQPAALAHPGAVQPRMATVDIFNVEEAPTVFGVKTVKAKHGSKINLPKTPTKSLTRGSLRVALTPHKTGINRTAKPSFNFRINKFEQLEIESEKDDQYSRSLAQALEPLRIHGDDETLSDSEQRLGTRRYKYGGGVGDQPSEEAEIIEPSLGERNTRSSRKGPKHIQVGEWTRVNYIVDLGFYYACSHNNLIITTASEC